MNEIMIPDSKLMEYLDIVGVGKDISKNERTQFLEIAKAYGLNPFKREIYISAYGQGNNRQCSILVGYEVYIQRAEKSGKLDGYEVTTSGDVPNMTATITIKRKDWSKPFTHTVEYSEYVQRKGDGTINKFWKDKPKTMLKKVAISQGMRLCFSVDLGGMPYATEEMPDFEEINPIKNEEKKVIEKIVEEPLIPIFEIKALNTLISKVGADVEKIKTLYKVSTTKNLTKKQAIEVIDKLSKQEKILAAKTQEEKMVEKEIVEGELMEENKIEKDVK